MKFLKRKRKCEYTYRISVSASMYVILHTKCLFPFRATCVHFIISIFLDFIEAYLAAYKLAEKRILVEEQLLKEAVAEGMG